MRESNTNNCILYGHVSKATNTGTSPYSIMLTIDISKDHLGTLKVCGAVTGWLQSSTTITLSAKNGSGLSGTVYWTYNSGAKVGDFYLQC
jgi:hypothetical protein